MSCDPLGGSQRLSRRKVENVELQQQKLCIEDIHVPKINWPKNICQNWHWEDDWKLYHVHSQVAWSLQRKFTTNHGNIQFQWTPCRWDSVKFQVLANNQTKSNEYCQINWQYDDHDWYHVGVDMENSEYETPWHWSLPLDTAALWWTHCHRPGWIWAGLGTTAEKKLRRMKIQIFMSFFN